MNWSIDLQGRPPLHEQIAANVRRGLATGDLAPGERLPPAADLAGVLDVNPNTVLQAYRQLRDEDLLEFRRGRGVRVRADAAVHGPVVDAVRELLALGHTHGYTARDLARLVDALS